MAATDIRIPAMAGQTIAVLGLAKSGLSAARALKASGAAVWGWDDNAKTRAEANAAGIPLVDLAGADWSKPSALVLSPGIPHRFPKPHPVAALATARRCPIIGDIELMARAGLGARFIGITGTNGKSTTTALIGHVLRSAGLRAEVGGNLGTPALELAALGKDGIYVLEMSSYQLELTHALAFDVAVLLNITPDHLDRHGGMDGYIAAKSRIFMGQGARQTAVVGVDDPTCNAISTTLKLRSHLNDTEATRIAPTLVASQPQHVVPISAEGPVAGGVYAHDGWLQVDRAGKTEHVLRLAEATNLLGKHNWQNAAAAFAACAAIGLATPRIIAGIKSYPGLAHRQELIATIGDVRYINDSKATNADATAKALACYQPIYWILGGRAKETGLEGLEPFYPRIAHAFLIGEAADRFAAALEGRVAYTKCGTLAAALSAAHRQAQAERRPGAVVLLSPAAASFDQFANFEERGEVFRKLVEAVCVGPMQANGGAGRRRMQ
jgi:UDP-N-acetylmuramoylalanine--D-glutamate ligase